jgi:uncharacterized phage protein (TIGR01671 family)
MNREIKFRARRTNNGEWVEGDLITGVGTKHGRMYILPRVVNVAKLQGCDPIDGYEVDPETVCQFTGLRDRNGREIYEGDIFQVAKNRTYKVLYTSGAECDYEWIGGCFILFQTNELQMPFDEFAIKNGEVIGNIYQNSELL